MAIRHINIFQNASIIVEDLTNPQSGKADGKQITILDNDTGDIYQYPASDEIAKLVGQKLMGIGGVQPANGTDLQATIKQLGDKAGKKR